MPARELSKRSLFGIQNWLPLVSMGLNVLYFVVERRVTTPLEDAGEPSYRIAFVSNELWLVSLGLQLVCIVVASIFALRPPKRALGVILTMLAALVFCAQVWLLPLVLLWMPCSNWGTRSCPV